MTPEDEWRLGLNYFRDAVQNGKDGWQIARHAVDHTRLEYGKRTRTSVRVRWGFFSCSWFYMYFVF